MKKFFRMVMALTLVGGVLAFSGCTDYEDDINALDDRVSALESTVAELQSQIEAGAVITNVEQTADGVTVTLSDGSTFTITNGADGQDGTPGSVISINEDGYWCIDGVPTEYPATGEKGEQGEAGKDAPTVYYVPGTEGDQEGFWVKVTEEEGKDPVYEVTDITWLPEGTLTAVWDTENQQLIISNVEGAENGTVIIPLSTGMVTSVELVLSYNGNNGDNFKEPNVASNAASMVYTTATEQDNVFEEKDLNGKAISNQITFKKGTQVQTEASFLVRVSPANAVLTEDMISLVNSQGDNLDGLVKVTKVEKYNGLLTRAAVNSGLWTVTTELVSYDQTTFNKATTAKVNGADKHVLFAVQVNNTADSDDERYVTSSYDLTLDWEKYTPANGFNFVVSNTDNARHVSAINNRYSFADNKSLPDYKGADKTESDEYTWKDGTPSTTPIFKASQGTVNTTDDTADDRHGADAFPAVQGEPITIALTTGDDTNVKKPENIRAIYVTLDRSTNAVESAPSEWNAWEGYEYDGLNEVVEGTSTTITIDGTNVINDFIGFRVFAVNYDGTLVDPDGKAFYVRIGSTSADWNGVETHITPDAKNTTHANEETSDPVMVSGLTKLSTGNKDFTWKGPDGKDQTNFDVYFLNAQGDIVFTTAGDATSTSATDFDKVAMIVTMPTATNWYDVKEEDPYVGTLTIRDANEFVLATINVSMTKHLPGVPEDFTVKSGQLDANGIYNCYLIPTNDGSAEAWTAVDPGESWNTPGASYGMMDMDDVFNWGDGEDIQYEITFADAAFNASLTGYEDVEVPGNDNLSVLYLFVDNETQHATVVSYNYGDISYARHNNSSIKDKDYVVTVDEFTTVFNSIYYNNTYSWHWATIEEIAEEYGGEWAKKNDDGSYVNEAPSTDLVYGETTHLQGPYGDISSFDKVILGHSARDGRYSAWLSEPYQNSLFFVEGHVISNGNGVVDEYFKVTGDKGSLVFDPVTVSDSTNPTVEVPSTLLLVYADMYGNRIPVQLPVTVVPR